MPDVARLGPQAVLWEVLREPMFLLLMACGAIYLALGDRQEALMLLGFVALVIVMTWVQKRRSQEALEALRDCPVVLPLLNRAVGDASHDAY